MTVDIPVKDWAALAHSVLFCAVGIRGFVRTLDVWAERDAQALHIGLLAIFAPVCVLWLDLFCRAPFVDTDPPRILSITGIWIVILISAWLLYLRNYRSVGALFGLYTGRAFIAALFVSAAVLALRV